MVATQTARGVSRFEPVDGIDFALCNPRPAFDLAMVETAREAGADVRERTSLVDVRWTGGRAIGVRVREQGGREYDIDCALVIGADGRGSTTAAKVGAARPYRGSRNGRGLAFVYADDPQVGTVWRNRVIQLRARDTHTLVFPCPDDRMLVLFMGPAEEIPLFRKDPQGMWDRMLAENPIAAERVGDAPNRTKMRSTGSVSAFYRRSSGPGWALAGDAGHFKDPVIGQGMRDAMRFGRLLGEAVAPVVDDPRAHRPRVPGGRAPPRRRVPRELPLGQQGVADHRALGAVRRGAARVRPRRAAAPDARLRPGATRRTTC